MLDTDELLAALKARNIRNIDMARTLDLPDSRIPEIRDKRRKLTLDEGAKLVRAFGLEQAQAVVPVPQPVTRLMILYIAQMVGRPLDPDSTEMAELIADIQAFARFVADPQVRDSAEAAEGFFRAMQLRSRTASEDQSENNQHHAH